MNTIYVGTAEAKQRFSELVNQVFYGGKQIVVTSRGKPKIALVAVDKVKPTVDSKGQQETEKQRRKQAFKKLLHTRDQVLQETRGDLTDPVEVLRQLRDERDQQILQAGMR